MKTRRQILSAAACAVAGIAIPPDVGIKQRQSREWILEMLVNIPSDRFYSCRGLGGDVFNLFSESEIFALKDKFPNCEWMIFEKNSVHSMGIVGVGHLFHPSQLGFTGKSKLKLGRNQINQNMVIYVFREIEHHLATSIA